ncbi:unnamed protein product [Bursaphelenchus xylophilus]|uniref:(pine wood nematode) hypothetical protein n=1 Tax=Bursaphelenchus xylophilus TaxID=6326 RepID=A0A1I7RR39_BURXY|nr:unnamed protein product [Bursaphelenchus xylophilus]CAG9130830.1 unnamed protein product [Bursaphelenchus xylophilus]
MPESLSLWRKFSRSKVKSSPNYLRLILFFVFGLYVTSKVVDVIGFVMQTEESYPEAAPGMDSMNVVAKECSATTKICYNVVDYSSDVLGLNVNRVIYLNGMEKEVDTMVALIPLPGRTFHDSDTRFWSVNHTVIQSQYVALICIAPFVVGSVPSMNSDYGNASVLMVGLGGGSADMFYHTIRPQWNITVYEIDPTVVKLANKWFGVVDDDFRRTVIQDGVIAINESASKGLKYDVIVLDACDEDGQIPCPAKTFLQPHLLNNVKSMLTIKGCLIVNVLLLNNPDKNLGTVEKTLLNFFPLCVNLRPDQETNVIFICLPYRIQKSNLENTKKQWESEASQLMRRFDFRFHTFMDVMVN